MKHFYNILFCKLFLFFNVAASAQFMLSGAVFDETNITPVKDVKVTTTSGRTTLTDSMGQYHIVVYETDSISFFYNNKSTLKFAVHSIHDYSNFFVSLKVKVYSKYKMLPEVIVQNKTYRQDSLDRRERYASAFNYENPGVSVSDGNGSGVPGLDLDAFISMFQFKRNKSRASFQRWIVKQEQEDYIDYKFNKKIIQRMSGGMDSAYLSMYMKFYRPTYEFIISMSEFQFIEYIKRTTAIFLEAFPEAKKETEMKTGK